MSIMAAPLHQTLQDRLLNICRPGMEDPDSPIAAGKMERSRLRRFAGMRLVDLESILGELVERARSGQTAEWYH
jgi:hypothetical protein